MIKGLIALTIVILFGTISQLLLKVGLSKIGVLHFNLNGLTNVAGSFYIIAGLCTMATQFVFWLYALSRLDLSFAILMLCIVPVLIIIFSKFILNEDISHLRWIGAAIVIIGLFIVSKT